MEPVSSDWQDRKGVLAQVRFGLENGNVKSVLAFLEELSKKDIFVLGDKRCSEIWSYPGLSTTKWLHSCKPRRTCRPKLPRPLLSKWSTPSQASRAVIMMGARCDNQDMAGEDRYLEAPIRLAMILNLLLTSKSSSESTTAGGPTSDCLSRILDPLGSYFPRTRF